jgi:hypothetical protein
LVVGAEGYALCGVIGCCDMDNAVAEEERAMLHGFVRRNVGEIDLLIKKAEQRLSQYEVEAGRAEGGAEVGDKMRAGLKRLRVYRGLVEKMDLSN